MKKMIVAGVGAVALLGAAAGGTWFVMRPEPAPAIAGAADGPGEPAAAKPIEVFYHHVQPEFIVNLPGAGQSRYLMVEMSIVTDDEKAQDVIDKHQAELRNDLLMLLGEQDALSLAGSEGKTALRGKASEIVDALVARHYAPEHVLDVYLTRFVIQ